jgi:hypothetical protein
MKNPFIETKKTIVNSINESLPNYAAISITSHNNKTIELVIGAEYDNRYCCLFSKNDLEELIKTLVEIHDVMDK